MSCNLLLTLLLIAVLVGQPCQKNRRDRKYDGENDGTAVVADGPGVKKEDEECTVSAVYH